MKLTNKKTIEIYQGTFSYKDKPNKKLKFEVTKMIINDKVTYEISYIEMLNNGYGMFDIHEQSILDGLSIEDILYKDNILIDLDSGL